MFYEKGRGGGGAGGIWGDFGGVTKTKSALNGGPCKKNVKYFSITLSVIVRENRAEPKDRGRPFTFIFSQYKSYPKRLTTMIFAEVGVRFSSRYHHIMILASQAV